MLLDVNNECFCFRIGDVAVGVKVSYVHLFFLCCTFYKSPASDRNCLVNYSAIDTNYLTKNEC